MPRIFRKILAVIFPLQYDRLWGSLEIFPDDGWNKLNFAPPVSSGKGIDEMVKWYKGLMVKEQG
jgi:hypothetical protein